MNDSTEYQGRSDNRTRKLIAWCAILAIVAVMYIIVASKNNQDAAASAGGTAGTTTSTMTDTTTSTGTSAGTSTDAPASATAGTYSNGTYSATGTYRTPEGSESIEVTLTIADGTVTDSAVEASATDRKSAVYQEAFAENYEQYVVGKSLDAINLSRVSGSSLTTNGFNLALAEIKTEAAS